MMPRGFQTRALVLAVLLFSGVIAADFWLGDEIPANATPRSSAPDSVKRVEMKATKANSTPLPKSKQVEFWAQCLANASCPALSDLDFDGAFFDESLAPARQELSLALRDWKRENCADAVESPTSLGMPAARVLAVANATGQRELLEGLACRSGAGDGTIVDALFDIAPENLESFFKRVLASGADSRRHLLDALRAIDQGKQEPSRDWTLARIRALERVRPNELELRDWIGPICRDTDEPVHWRRELRSAIETLLEKMGSEQSVNGFCPQD